MSAKEITFGGRQAALPIHTIFCIGRNYAAHARELNNPVPGSPVVFTKPLNTVIFDSDCIRIPSHSEEVHYEVEVLVAIGKRGKNIPESEAYKHIAGYGIGIDVTARDIQQKLKGKSHPWELAKGCDTFAPISSFVPSGLIDEPENLDFSLQKNSAIVQQGNTANMIFPIPKLIENLSDTFTLQPGDIIFTGTPEGVGSLDPGDHLKAVLGDDLAVLQVDVV